MKKLKYYFKRYQFLLYLIAFIFAVIGSLQMLWPNYANNPVKGFFVILYSVVKLFVFQPLIGFTNPDNTLIYDAAIILAPLGTVVGFFSVFDKLYQMIKLKLTHLNQQHLVVMGTNDYAVQFMKKAKSKYKILCLAQADTENQLIESLNKESILVVTIDYQQQDSFENKKLFFDYKLDEAIAFVSFEPEPMCYGFIKVLASLNPEYKRVMPLFVHHLDEQLKEVIQKPLDKLTCFDIRYFNIFTLMSFDLMKDESFSLFDKTKDFSQLTLTSLEALQNAFGKVHLLLVGFGELGQNILNVTSNQGTINPFLNMDVTILDRQMTSKFEKFDARINHLERVANFNLVNLDLNSRTSTQKLEKINRENPFTAIIFTLKNTQDSLLNLERMERILPHVPTAIYCENMTEMEPIVEALSYRFNNLTYFGELDSVLTVEKIMNEDNYAKAKAFNATYNVFLSQWMGWDKPTASVDEQWLKISNIKKESSLFQTLHQNVKWTILEKLSESPSYPNSPAEILKMLKDKLANKRVEEQTDLIEQDVLMNYLCALEHKRWNNFYYMQNFDYADQTNETMRLHNCLIDDWDKMMQERRNTIIYDLLSWLSLDDA